MVGIGEESGDVDLDLVGIGTRLQDLSGHFLALPYAIMRNSLPVQLHDTLLSSKQPVSTHKDSLLTIMNHMPAHRSRCLSKINGYYVQLLENNPSILPGVR